MFRVALAARLAALAGLCLFLQFSYIAPAAALEAHIFRGAGDFSFISKGLTFSQGMDTLGDKFQRAGIRARVYRWQSVGEAYRDIMTRKPKAVAIMGHSMGALASISLVKKLQGSGVRVAYMGLIDIPGPTATAPANVEYAENFYSMFPVYGKLGKPRGHQGVVRNEFVSGEIHVTMDNSTLVHTAMIEGAAKQRAIEAAPSMHAFAQQERPVQQAEPPIDRIMTASTAHNGPARQPVERPGAADLRATGDPIPLSSIAAMPLKPPAYPQPRLQATASAATAALAPIE